MYANNGYATQQWSSNGYAPASQQWSTIDPNLQQHFVNNKLTQTRNGSQVLETQQAMKPGIGGKISNIVHRASERFSGNANSRWAAFGLQEPLLHEFPAKTSFAETRIGGWIFFSQNHFGWISHTDAQNRVIKTLIPWTNVTNIVPTSRVRGTAGKTYQFSPIMAPGTAAEGFQIFTRDNLIYQFFGVKKNIEQIFGLFNHSWTTPYGTRTGFTSGLHQGGFYRGQNAGLVQPSYGQTGLATGLAQPAYAQTGLATGLAQPTYGQTGLATGLAQPTYGQTGLATGLAQPAYGQTGLAMGLAQPGYAQTTAHHNPLDRNHDGRVNLQDLAPNAGRAGYAQTGLAQPAAYGQTGLVSGIAPQQAVYTQTGLASGMAPQQAVYTQTSVVQPGLAGQAFQQNNLAVKQGLVQPTTGMALGQTAPVNFRTY